MKDVEQFFRQNVETKRKPRGYNSFVSPQNNFSYQIDLFFISRDDMEEEQKFRAGLVCIDVLSKYAVVVPVKKQRGARCNSWNYGSTAKNGQET